MKKIRVMAAVTALLCCFQAGISMTGNADEINQIGSESTETDNRKTTYHAGDVNLDGEVDILDVILLNKALVGKTTLSDVQNAVADFNQDTKVDAIDSLDILKQIVGLYTSEIKPVGTVNLSQSVASQEVEGKNADEAFIKAQTEFYLTLFQNAEQTTPEANILVSPYSVMQALAMTANGADGSTKSEMEQTLGGLPLNDLNQYLYTQRMNQPNDEKCKLSTANSIWYRNDADRLQVLPEFLQVNADYYNADAFSAPFDSSTVEDINNWCNDKTDNMIPELLKEIDGNTVMYLINAVAFDAKWVSPYDSEYAVYEQEFTALDGSIQTAKMMYSEDEYLYLTDEHAEGFYKEYQGGKYAFAALLPEEGLSIDEYISELTAESLQNTLANPEPISVHTVMPKFSYDYDIKLNDTLIKMGMSDAFNPLTADFSKMADTASGYLYIGEVKHKTHIDVTEEGTRAAAVTSVKMNDATIAFEYRKITLNRPFVYMIVDMDTHLPVFMGAVKSVS